MKYDNRKIAGSLLFIGAVLCVLGIIVAEALYTGYSTSENYISDLGVGPSSLIFNSSLFLLGVLTVGGAYFIQRAFDFRLFSIFAAITGIGTMGGWIVSRGRWSCTRRLFLHNLPVCRVVRHYVLQTAETTFLLLLCHFGGSGAFGACSLCFRHFSGFR